MSFVKNDDESNAVSEIIRKWLLKIKHACLTPIVVALLQSGGCVLAQCGFCLFGICMLLF